MAYKREEIEKSRLIEQEKICADIAVENAGGDERPLALIDTYGCQQNEADSEILRGYIELMGFGFTDDPDRAELIVINTCAIREHAELRVLGNIGALTHAKARNPRLLVAVCGCMVQQPHMAKKLKKSFRLVDIVFGPHELWRFPELYKKARDKSGRVFEISPSEGVIAEGAPISRKDSVKAWLSVMYGCNNFCTYCVVPSVRGRERSRQPENIISEAEALVAEGYKDITLLGQNVNSYGRDLGGKTDFSDLIRRINEIPGEFLIRFMTSHPRDATEKLFRTMAECEKCAKHLHLPVQSGSDRVLRAMNRHYDRAKYTALVRSAREYMPELVLTTDIIVGFPGETEEEFEDTLSLIREVRYDAMFTFIFSPREGTKAALMPDIVSKEEKQRRFERLVETANAISAEIHEGYRGKTMRVLIDGAQGRGEYPLTARTNGGRLVHLRGDAELVGSFADVRIEDVNTWALFGEPLK